MTYKFQQISKRPYKNLKEFVEKKLGHDWKHCQAKNIDWPCEHCSGSGKAFRSEDRDVYEGYKGASRYPCAVCSGSGSVTKEFWEASYEIAIKNWEETREREQFLLESQKSSILKLTKAELFALTRGSFNMDIKDYRKLQDELIKEWRKQTADAESARDYCG